jgi:GntR family transcriptional repressor for pyruvate dehydrogenase complex
MAKSPNQKRSRPAPLPARLPAPLLVETPRAADAVAAHLEQMLVQGVLRPGEKLAAERDLAEKLGVSRPTLRDAMARLAARGLLTLARDGARVAQYLAPFSAPLAELFADKPRVAADYFEFRRALEAEAARLAAERATDLDRRAIADVVKRMREAHRADDPAREAALDVDLHLAIYEAAHNLVVLHVMRVLSDLLRNNIFYNRDQLFRRAGARERLLEQHLSIAEAILAGDARRAGEAASAHIEFVFETVEALRRDERRLATSLQRLNRADLVAG